MLYNTIAITKNKNEFPIINSKFVKEQQIFKA